MKYIYSDMTPPQYVHCECALHNDDFDLTFKFQIEICICVYFTREGIHFLTCITSDLLKKWILGYCAISNKYIEILPNETFCFLKALCSRHVIHFRHRKQWSIFKAVKTQIHFAYHIYCHGTECSLMRFTICILIMIWFVNEKLESLPLKCIRLGLHIHT